jgi:PTS system nitrogen regulatory IIA component
MRLADILKVEGIRTDLSAKDKDATLRALARLFAESDGLLDEETVYRAFSERERLATTGVGSGVAIPHGRVDINEFKVVMAISPDGVPFDSVDGEPAHIFFAVLGPVRNPADQLRMLARISRVLKDQSVRARLLAAGSSADLLQIVAEEELRH